MPQWRYRFEILARRARPFVDAGQKTLRFPATALELIATPGGDVIKELTGAFPRVVLAEGDYRAIVRSDGRTYERNFKVITGVGGEVELLAR